MISNKDQENLIWVQQVLQIRNISLQDLRDGSLLLEIINRFGHLSNGERYHSRPATDLQTNENLFLIMSILIRQNWLKNCGPLRMDQLFGNAQDYYFILDVIRQNVTNQIHSRQDLINRVINILVEDRNPYLKLENLYHLFNLNRHKLVHQDSRYLGRVNQDPRTIQHEPFEDKFAKTFGQAFARQFGQKFGEQFGQSFATTFGSTFGANFGHEIAPFFQQQMLLQQKIEQIILNQDIQNRRQQKSDQEIKKITNNLNDLNTTNISLTQDFKANRQEQKQDDEEQKSQKLIQNTLADQFQQQLDLNTSENDENETWVDEGVQNQKKQTNDPDDC